MITLPSEVAQLQHGRSSPFGGFMLFFEPPANVQLPGARRGVRYGAHRASGSYPRRRPRHPTSSGHRDHSQGAGRDCRRTRLGSPASSAGARRISASRSVRRAIAPGRSRTTPATAARLASRSPTRRMARSSWYRRALRRALPLLGDTFAVVYGDSYLTCDYAAAERQFPRVRQARPDDRLPQRGPVGHQQRRIYRRPHSGIR